MNHTIRPFERQDGTAVTQLWNTRLPHDRIEQAWLLRLLDTPNYDSAGVLVSEVDGQIVGFVASVIRFTRLWKGTWCAPGSGCERGWHRDWKTHGNDLLEWFLLEDAMDKLRIAVVGCGNVSQGHIRGWLNHPERVEVVALADVEMEAAQERRERFKLSNAQVYTDWQEAVRREDVDVVNICTPGHLHTEMIVAALEAGKHVMTEKPTGWNLEECRKLRWYAQRYAHLKVGVGYSLRYYPLNIRVRELVQSGAIGRVMFAEGSHNHPHDCSHLFEGEDMPQVSDRAGHYIPGSELAGPTHVFDLMRYLFGEVRDVFAFRERMGTFVLMRFQSGATGKATAGTASDRGIATPHVLCIQGTEGTIFTQNSYQEGDAWSVPGYHGFMVRDKQQTPIEVGGKDTGHGDATRTLNFLDGVQKGTPLIAPLEDAVRTSELLHAIWDSYTLEIRVPVHQAGKTG